MSAESADVEELRQLVDAAHKRIDELESELEDLRGSSIEGRSATDASPFDARDSAVLDALGPGQTVTVSDLQQLYRTHTDVRAKQTLKSRIKTLTGHDRFETRSAGRWRYVGDDR